MNKRLLVVSYYYAPLRAIASIRWSKLVKYLIRDGWEVDVITTASTGAEDSTLAAELPQLGNIIRISHADSRFAQTGYKANVSAAEAKQKKNSLSRRIKDVILASAAFRLYKKLTASRPQKLDLERGEDFAREAEKYLIAHGGVSKYDAVVCTYGPVGDTMLALRIKKRWPDTKLIMDFRDPMVSETRTAKINRIYGRLQNEVCAVADEVVTISAGTAEQIFKSDGSPADVIYNGYDRSDLAGITAQPDGKFSFCYAGSLYRGKRDLTAFFRVLGAAVSDGDIDPADVIVNYAGQHIDILRSQAEPFGLSDRIVWHGTVDRADSLRLQASSAMLLLASWNTPSEHGVLTGKFPEYMMMGKPIVALICGSDPDSEIRSVIGRGKLGAAHEEARADADDAALRDWLVMQYREYKNSGRPRFEPVAECVASFDYENLSKQYEKLLTEVCG